MIGTADIKRDRDTVFTLESYGEPDHIILLVGSCRCVGYVNYFNRWNEMSGRRLRLHVIEPNDYCVDEQGRGLDMLDVPETNPNVLRAIQSATVFFHEHYESYGMFNTNRAMPKNIYQFGMRAPMDVCIPNFHDRFILFTEQLQFRRKELEGLSRDEKLADMMRYGWKAVSGFCDVCRKSSFPDFAIDFLATWTRLRYFWAGNHVSRHFHLYIFRQFNERFLHLPLTDEFWSGAESEDLFAKPCAPVTQDDVDAYGLSWDQSESPITSLQL